VEPVPLEGSQKLKYNTSIKHRKFLAFINPRRLKLKPKLIPIIQ
jgi:hypothetical protein